MPKCRAWIWGVSQIFGGPQTYLDFFVDGRIKITSYIWIFSWWYLLWNEDGYRFTIYLADDFLLYHELPYNDASHRQWESELSNLSFNCSYWMREASSEVVDEISHHKTYWQENVLPIRVWHVHCTCSLHAKHARSRHTCDIVMWHLLLWESPGNHLCPQTTRLRIAPYS